MPLNTNIISNKYTEANIRQQVRLGLAVSIIPFILNLPKPAEKMVNKGLYNKKPQAGSLGLKAIYLDSDRTKRPLTVAPARRPEYCHYRNKPAPEAYRHRLPRCWEPGRSTPARCYAAPLQRGFRFSVLTGPIMPGCLPRFNR